MSSTTVRVLQPGFTSVQDLGRRGLGRVGVAGNGAADAHAATVASVLVGNPIGSPLLEVTGTGLSFTVDRPSLMAVTGAASHVDVDGHRQPDWQTLVVPGGSTVVVHAPDRGLRSYVALGGELVAGRTLGSVAPDPLLGVGTRLSPGDRLTVRTRFAGLDHGHSQIPLFRFDVTRPVQRDPLTIDVTPGPEVGEFDAGALESAGVFEVQPQSDYIGLRLTGDAPVRRTGGETLSRGVPVGAVEITATGDVLVLLRGRLVTAGYPVVAVATTVAIDRLAQARPGDRLAFRQTTVAEAVRQRRDQAAAVATLASRVGAALAASGLDRVH